MALFQRSAYKLSLIKQKKISDEKELQKLIESNLDIVFSCRFIASEFPTGQVHGGRIDTLAISEDNNPVIIEYKVMEHIPEKGRDVSKIGHFGTGDLELRIKTFDDIEVSKDYIKKALQNIGE